MLLKTYESVRTLIEKLTKDDSRWKQHLFESARGNAVFENAKKGDAIEHLVNEASRLIFLLIYKI